MFRPHGTRYAPRKSDQPSMSAEMLKRASTSAFSPMISKSFTLFPIGGLLEFGQLTMRLERTRAGRPSRPTRFRRQTRQESDKTLSRPQISDGASTEGFPAGPRRPGRREGHYAPSAGGASGDDATGSDAYEMQAPCKLTAQL